MPTPESFRYEDAIKPKIGIDVSSIAQLEQLAWTDVKECPIIDETDLPAPIRSVKLQMDGSSQAFGGEFGFKLDITLFDSARERLYQLLDDFSDRYDGVAFDTDEFRRVVQDDSGNGYFLWVEGGSSTVRVMSCGSSAYNAEDPELSSLFHGVDAFGESFDDFSGLAIDLLGDIYEGFESDRVDIRLKAECPEDLGKTLPEPTPTARKIRLHDIGGLEDEKAAIEQLLFGLRNPQILAKWGAERQQGLLLYGPPGTGKTTLVEAAANEIGADLLSVKSTDIYDMWLGNSEKKMQQIIDNALRVTKPTILLFDEIDGIISSDSHSSHVRVAALFKQGTTQIAAQSPHVLIAATTNNTENIDPAILRAGRFDVKLYIPSPDSDSRKAIIGLLVEKYFDLRERKVFDAMELDYGALARAADGLTGADLTTIVKGLVAAKAFQEMRTKMVPSPINQDEFLRAIHKQRRQQT